MKAVLISLKRDVHLFNVVFDRERREADGRAVEKERGRHLVEQFLVLGLASEPDRGANELIIYANVIGKLGRELYCRIDVLMTKQFARFAFSWPWKDIVLAVCLSVYPALVKQVQINSECF